MTTERAMPLNGTEFPVSAETTYRGGRQKVEVRWCKYIMGIHTAFSDHTGESVTIPALVPNYWTEIYYEGDEQLPGILERIRQI